MKTATYHDALTIFHNTVESELRVSKTLNAGLLKMADQAIIDHYSAEISNATHSGQRVWLTSDLHFGHYNIIKYSGRPFFDLREMTEAHLSLLSKVPDNEWLVLVGDMALSGDYQAGVETIRKIPGRKLLVAGNHDLRKDGFCALAKEPDLFEAVVPFLYWSQLNSLVIVTHYPVAMPFGSKQMVLNYHGHLHQKTLDATEQVKYVNVGWDVHYGLLCI